MSDKALYFIAVFIGTTISGFVPALWGGDTFSFAGLFFSEVGGFVGIFLVYRSVS